MSQFDCLFSENKLRIPLSAYAAQIIETDCVNFSKKKTTLINTVILNYYQTAESSISLRMLDYKKELYRCFSKMELQHNEQLLSKILKEKANELQKKYATRKKADVNWQITLNKKVIEMLTEDPYSQEEKYYENKPGRFIQSLIEEYVLKPHFVREEIICSQMINLIEEAKAGACLLKISHNNGKHFFVKPYMITSDPLSMYHYLIGYSSNPESIMNADADSRSSKPLSIRLSKIVEIKKFRHESGILSLSEEKQIKKEIDQKGVQFLTGVTSHIKIWLSDNGIKKYNSQIHLRPSAIVDSLDEHIYHFECTETQVLFYFLGFGKDAKVISPTTLADQFISSYRAAVECYEQQL